MEWRIMCLLEDGRTEGEFPTLYGHPSFYHQSREEEKQLLECTYIVRGNTLKEDMGCQRVHETDYNESTRVTIDVTYVYTSL